MKTLIAGIVLIIVLGVGGLVYRNVLERSAAPGGGLACTLEAKICPDGTTVGRVPPSCAFAACPWPNIELDSANIAFALPQAYATSTGPLATTTLIAAYDETGTTTPSSILIYEYPIEAGQDATGVMLARALLEPSDMPPKDVSAFTPKIIGTRTFSEITLERFEGTVATAYFLPRQNDVLEFEIVERGAANWTNPNLIPDNLPEHQALLQMLGTFEDLSPQPE